MLQVYAYQNPFKPGEDKDQYCFRSVVDETVDGERLVREIAQYNSFDANDAVQGVFVRAQGGERLRIGRYTRIGSNVVEGFLPDDLAAGSYEVTLVTKPGLRRYEQDVCSTRITVE